MTRCLVIIDIQNDYFEGGAFPLVGPGAAARAAAGVLHFFRENGEPVIHVRHVWDAPDATFLRPGTPGVEINEAVSPIVGEPVVVKEFPNSFRATTLADELAAVDATELVVAGMMTSMCVDATVRAASDLGFTVTVVTDACAAPDLVFEGRTIAAADVHASFLAALDGEYATLRTAAALTAG